jgi:KDO2-lipid IV(A) lauroyltransferase
MAEVRATLRERVEYGVTRAFVGVVALLPEWLAYAIAGGVGRLFFRLSASRRRLALRFLRQAYGSDRSDAELLRLGARATANIFRVPLDSVRLVRLAQRGRLLQRIDVSEVEGRLPAAPFLVVTAHLGCWEAGAMALAALGFDVHAVVKAARNPLIDRWAVENRVRAGFHIHRRRGGIRALVRVLSEGGVCAMVIDQNQRLRPVVAPFFGAPARCERSTAVIALRGGYPVVVAGVVRVGTGMRFRALFQGVERFERSGDPAQDLVAATSRLNRLLEDMIRRVPDQYLWIHDRFRGATTAEPPAAMARTSEGS